MRAIWHSILKLIISEFEKNWQLIVRFIWHFKMKFITKVHNVILWWFKIFSFYTILIENNFTSIMKKYVYETINKAKTHILSCFLTWDPHVFPSLCTISVRKHAKARNARWFCERSEPRNNFECVAHKVRYATQNLRASQLLRDIRWLCITTSFSKKGK